MTTDSSQPKRPPASPPEEPQADAQAAPPTVPVPVIKAPATKPAAAPDAAAPTTVVPAQPAPQAGQAPPTQAVPRWQAPPPPPPGPPRPQQERPQQQGLAQSWNQPQPPEPQQWGQPQSAWTGVQPWIEPQNDVPGRQPRSAGPWGPPPQQPPANQSRFRRRQRKRRVRRSFMALFTVIVLLILLVIGDRVALAVTENDMASQFTQNGFPVKPSVSIAGFPFLTQLAAKDFNTVNISASSVPAGPVTIDTIHATLNGVHISSFSSSASARVDKLNATAFISFGALASAGGIAGGSGVKITQAGPNTVKISADLGGIFNDSEEAQITTTGPQTISVKVLPGKGALGPLLSSFGSFSFSLPKGVPASLRITNLTLNNQGLTVSASATDATFSK